MLKPGCHGSHQRPVANHSQRECKRRIFMDKTALLKAIKEAEAKAASDLEDAQARKQQALAAAQSDAERTKREAFAAVDQQAADQVAQARRRIEGDKAEKL